MKIIEKKFKIKLKEEKNGKKRENKNEEIFTKGHWKERRQKDQILIEC